MTSLPWMARLLDGARKRRTDEVESVIACCLGRQMCSTTKPSAGVSLLYGGALPWRRRMAEFRDIIRRFADNIE